MRIGGGKKNKLIIDLFFLLVEEKERERFRVHKSGKKAQLFFIVFSLFAFDIWTDNLHDSPNITATPVAASRTLDRWNKCKCSRLNVYKYISLHFNAGKRECFEWIIVAMSTNIECEREATCRRRRRKRGGKQTHQVKWSEMCVAKNDSGSGGGWMSERAFDINPLQSARLGFVSVSLRYFSSDTVIGCMEMLEGWRQNWREISLARSEICKNFKGICVLISKFLAVATDCLNTRSVYECYSK